MFRFSFKILILICSLVILTGLSGCGGSNSQPSEVQTQDQTDQTNTDDSQTLSGENLLTIDADTLQPNQDEKLEFAQKKAEEWQNNAQLVAVQVEIPASLKEESISSRYIFSSSSVNYYYWTIAIAADNSSYIRALIPKEDYLSPNLNIILNNFWQINFAEALQIADQNGGSAWRENHTLGQVVLVLSRGQPNNWHYWTVEYVAVNQEGERINQENLKIKISAQTGEIAE